MQKGCHLGVLGTSLLRWHAAVLFENEKFQLVAQQIN
jgi:hypothetical protein